MKTNVVSLAAPVLTLLLLATSLLAQQPGAPGQPIGVGSAVIGHHVGKPPPHRDPNAPKFDLSFGGGTPRQLVDAVEAATGERVNVIINEADKDVQLPALKMRQVTVEDLFTALEQSSRKTVPQITGTYYTDFGGKGARHQYSMFNVSYGFTRVGTVWVFTNNQPVPLPDEALPRTRFYQLNPYLMENIKVEDITTAIQTAWKMMAQKEATPRATELKFHPETGLLIAVGDPIQVQVIDDVLNTLRPDLAIKAKPAAEAPAKTNKENAKP